MSHKHIVAINLIKDELTIIADKVKFIQAMEAKQKFVAAIYPNNPNAQVYVGLRNRRALKALLEKGRALMDTLKYLEEDK